MGNVLFFIAKILVQSIMFNYLTIVTSELISQQKFSKKQIAISYLASVFIILITDFLKVKIALINTFISYILLFLIVFFILKLKLSKSILATVLTNIQVLISELIAVFCGMIAFKEQFTNFITSKSNTILLLIIQCIIAVAIITVIKIIMTKKKSINEFLNKLTLKHILLFTVVLLIYIIPTVIVFILTKYEYSPIFILINAIQFTIISIFMFSYLIKSLENEKSQSDLFTSELHNKTLIGMVDGVRTLKHDYNNIMQALNGYVSTKQYDKLQEHINGVLKECNVVNNLSVVDPKIFNEPAIYGIVGSKFFLANEADITFDFDVTSDIASIPFPKPDLSRILGILLDNAIEATKKAPTQYIRLEFKYDNRKNADIIRIINTYDTNVKINLVDIYKKGYSTKEVKSGIGLWEVKKLIAKNINSQIYAEINENKFIQNIIIER